MNRSRLWLVVAFCVTIAVGFAVGYEVAWHQFVRELYGSEQVSWDEMEQTCQSGDPVEYRLECSDVMRLAALHHRHPRELP